MAAEPTSIICIDLTSDSESDDDPQKNSANIPSTSQSSYWLNETSVNLENASGSRSQAVQIREQGRTPGEDDNAVLHLADWGKIFEDAGIVQQISNLQPFVAVEDGLTASFARHSVEQLQDLESQINELELTRDNWGIDEERSYDRIRDRFIQLLNDYMQVTGNEELNSPEVWNPIDLSGVSRYRELNDAAEALINNNIQQAKRMGIHNIILPTFQEILKTISKHPVWRIFLDEDDEYELAASIVKYVARISKERRESDFFNDWNFGNVDSTDPALHDAELEEKLKRNQEVSAVANGCTPTKRIRLNKW